MNGGDIPLYICADVWGNPARRQAVAVGFVRQRSSATTYNA